MKLLLPLFVIAGCAATDPCAGHSGACLGVRATGSGRVDQLHLILTGAATLDGLTPARPGPPRALPVTTAIFLPAVSGPAQLVVAGLLEGNEVGRGRADLTLAPGRHQTITLSLAGAGADLSMPADLLINDDLAMPDLAVPDLATDDLASADAAPDAALDLRMIDLIPPDDLSLPRRHIFLMSPRQGDLGTLAYLDSQCGLAAQAGGLPDAGYRAVVAYPTVEPKNHISLAEGRIISVPSGAIVATDSTFFATSDHLGAINELANGGPAPATCCVWTQYSQQGFRISAPDCNGWTVGTDASSGLIGDCQKKDIEWAISAGTNCDESCYIYCIEQ